MQVQSHQTQTVQDLIQAVETADSSSSLFRAVQQLSIAAVPEAIPTLVEVLQFNNPGAAVAAVDGLVRLGSESVGPLLSTLAGENYGARAWAIRALAGIGDPRALNILASAATQDFALSVRRSAAKGLGALRWQELETSEIFAAQEQAATALLQTSKDEEWVVRYAAIAGLQQIAATIAETHVAQYQQVHDRLEELSQRDPSRTIQARAQWALQILS